MPILLPREDEIVENITSFHSVSYHRILQNAVVTSVVIATGKAMHKKVRSGRCFAAHYLFFPCIGFGLMVSRGGGELSGAWGMGAGENRSRGNESLNDEVRRVVGEILDVCEGTFLDFAAVLALRIPKTPSPIGYTRAIIGESSVDA